MDGQIRITERASSFALLLAQLTVFEHTRIQGGSPDKPELDSAQLQQANSLLARIKNALQRESTLQDPHLLLRLRQHRSRLQALLPVSRLLDLPAELREQIWIFAVTECGPVARESVGTDLCSADVSGTRRSDQVLEQKAIRIDRHNRPLPPGE
jgi:hypothetical protein